MRISGTELSSVILSQTKKFKEMKSDAPKVSKQAKAKWDKSHFDFWVDLQFRTTKFPIVVRL